MRVLSIAMVVILFLAGVAHAEEPVPAGDAQTQQEKEKPSGALQRILLEREQKRLELADKEIQELTTELKKAQSNIAQIEALKPNTTSLSMAIEQFRNDFQALEKMMGQGGAQTMLAYQQMAKSLNGLFGHSQFPEGKLPIIGERQRTVAVLDALYDTSSWPRDMPSWTEIYPLSQLQHHSINLDGATPTVPQIRSAVSAATSFVNTKMSVALLTRLYEQDKDAVLEVWRRIAERAKLGIKDREQQIEQAKTAMVELDKLAEQQTKRNNTDANLSYTIWFMVLALVALFIATRSFSPEIQALIFQQRTLVEMIGMAFLLLTIIVLGTGEKIDRAVLGTLLGTVGGYIFGQQIRTWGPAAEAPKLAQSSMPIQPTTPAASLRRAAEAGSPTGNQAAPNPAQTGAPPAAVSPERRE